MHMQVATGTAHDDTHMVMDEIEYSPEHFSDLDSLVSELGAS